jgi:hypothetical protein
LSLWDHCVAVVFFGFCAHVQISSELFWAPADIIVTSAEILRATKKWAAFNTAVKGWIQIF